MSIICFLKELFLTLHLLVILSSDCHMDRELILSFWKIFHSLTPHFDISLPTIPVSLCTTIPVSPAFFLHAGAGTSLSQY